MDSRVLAIAPASPAQSAAAMREKLRLHTDAWDLATDLSHGIQCLVVIDTRSQDHYCRGHIPGAISLPHVEMTPERLARLDPSLLYISYCDGIGCNGSTQGALKLAEAGLQVKELLGGLDFWRRDGHPVATGPDAGTMRDITITDCGC